MYLVADTEAQTAYNDEELNLEVNVKLKRQRAILEHELKHGVANRQKLLEVRKEIVDKEQLLCNTMNTYLLGWSPLIKGRFKRYENNPDLQTEWIKENVTYYHTPKITQNPWQLMLDDLVMEYHDKIIDGGKYRLIIYFHNLDYDAQNFFKWLWMRILEVQFILIRLFTTIHCIAFRLNT